MKAEGAEKELNKATQSGTKACGYGQGRAMAQSFLQSVLKFNLKWNQCSLIYSFDHLLAEGQEKSEFAKQIQGFFLALGQRVVILFF